MSGEDRTGDDGPDRFGPLTGPEPGTGERLFHAVRLWLGRALS